MFPFKYMVPHRLVPGAYHIWGALEAVLSAIQVQRPRNGRHPLVSMINQLITRPQITLSFPHLVTRQVGQLKLRINCREDCPGFCYEFITAHRVA